MDAQRSEIDSIAGQVKQVREAATALLGQAETAANLADRADALEKAATLLKTAAEMESAVRRERSERIRDYVALFTPLVTIVTLAATLVAQNWQFLRSEATKREEAMDAQWQEAVKSISISGALSPGVIALQPFLRSSKYGDQARDAAVNLLSNSSDPVFFTSLFGTALTPVNWTNLERIVRLDRALITRANPVFNKSWNASKDMNDLTMLSKTEVETYTYVEAVAPAVTSEIVGVLRTPRVQNATVDLSGTYLKHGDMSGVNLGGVNIQNIRLNWSNLKDAELEGVTEFSGAVLHGTAWWQAKSINRPLLDYLKARAPFLPGAAYGPRVETLTQREYDDALRRLASSAK